MALFHTFSLPARNSGINLRKGKMQTPGNSGKIQQAAHAMYYLLHLEQKNLHYRGSRSLFFPPKLTRPSNNLHYNEHNVLMLCLTLLLIFTRTHSTALGRPGHVNTQLPPCFCSLCIFTIHKSVQLQCV